MKKPIVIVASHPDDEVLSAGALLLRARNFGRGLHIVWGTQGGKSTSRAASNRWNEADEVARRVHATYECLDLEDGRLEVGEVTGRVEEILKKHQPQMVVWPYGRAPEQHQDHCALHDALLNISKRWKYAKCCWLAGKTPVFEDSTFTPNLYLAHGEALMAEVQELMAIYSSERRKPFADPSVLQARSRRYAMEGQTGTTYAEPYMLVKGNPIGELFHIRPTEFYEETDGGVPVLEYLESLREEKARVIAMIDVLQTETPLPEDYFRPVGESLHALSYISSRGNHIHILYFIHRDDHYVLLHALSTSGSKIPADHLNLAEIRRENWLRRFGT